MSDKKPELTIVDKIEGKVLAYRNKTSIEFFPNTREVGFNDFSYSWEEIIAVSKKLEEFILEETLAWEEGGIGKIKEC